MESRSNFLRWGLPGWTSVVGFFGFVLIDEVVSRQSNILGLIEGTLTTSQLWQATIAGLLVAASGIPIGFLIYQVYFYIRWNSPVSTKGLLPPLVVGRKAELESTLRHLKTDELTFGEQWRIDLLPNLDDHRRAWYYLARLVMDAMIDKKEAVYARHSYLMNTLHSLGASHVGLAVGFLVYLGFRWRTTPIPVIYPVIACLVVAAIVVALSVEEHRTMPLVRLGRVALSHPADLILWCALFLFATLDPGLTDTLSYGAIFVGMVVLAIAWIYAERSDGWAIALVTALIAAVSLWIRISIGSTTESAFWGLSASTLVFAGLTIAFIKNRQNVRDQLVTMEHYYLCQYLESKNTT